MSLHEVCTREDEGKKYHLQTQPLAAGRWGQDVPSDSGYTESGKCRRNVNTFDPVRTDPQLICNTVLWCHLQRDMQATVRLQGDGDFYCF